MSLGVNLISDCNALVVRIDVVNTGHELWPAKQKLFIYFLINMRLKGLQSIAELNRIMLSCIQLNFVCRSIKV